MGVKCKERVARVGGQVNVVGGGLKGQWIALTAGGGGTKGPAEQSALLPLARRRAGPILVILRCIT